MLEIPKVESKIVINTQETEEIDWIIIAMFIFHEEENNGKCAGGVKDNHNIGSEFVTELSLIWFKKTFFV